MVTFAGVHAEFQDTLRLDGRSGWRDMGPKDLVARIAGLSAYLQSP